MRLIQLSAFSPCGAAGCEGALDAAFGAETCGLVGDFVGALAAAGLLTVVAGLFCALTGGGAGFLVAGVDAAFEGGRLFVSGLFCGFTAAGAGFLVGRAVDIMAKYSDDSL